MEDIDVLTKQMINKIIDKDTEDNIKNKTSLKDRMIIKSIKKLDNPFSMIDVKTVMKDLNICKIVAYRLFQREDFPAIRVGKSNQVMLIAYLLWKMDRKF